MSTKSLRLNFSAPDFLEKLKVRETSSVEVLVKTYTKQLTNAAYGLGFTDSDATELPSSPLSSPV